MSVGYLPYQGTSQPQTQVAIRLFRSHGGILRAAEARHLGIHQETLRTLVRQGILESMTRGVYRLTEMPIPEHVDLVVVAKKVPDGVFCLISALAFHHMTTQIPHEIYVMIPARHAAPKLDWPPVRFFRASKKVFDVGVETHQVGTSTLRVYDPAKTVADCFKYRNKIGVDVAVEALRDYLDRRDASFQTLLAYARTLRVERVITPYLEALQ